MTTIAPYRYLDEIADWIPDGYSRITDPTEAIRYVQHHFTTNLEPKYASRYGWLWQQALKIGFQDGGLLLVGLGRLPRPPGLRSSETSREMAGYLTAHHLWIQLPVHLRPEIPEHMPGRPRVYAVLRDERPPVDSTAGHTA